MKWRPAKHREANRRTNAVSRKGPCMNRQMKQWILRVVLGSVAVITTIIAAGLTPTDSVGSGAQAWYRSLTASEKQLLADPAALAGLPVEYRRALIPTLSPEQQVTVWRAVFSSFKMTHRLNDEQRALIAQTEQLLTPNMFRHGDTRNLAALSELRAQLTASLGQVASSELFNTAGPDPSHLNLSAMETARYEWRRSRAAWPHRLVALIAPIVKAQQCDCITSNDCFLSYCSTPQGCTPTSWECGSWFTQSCTSLCQYPN